MVTPYELYMQKQAINTRMAERMAEAAKNLRGKDVSGWRYNKLPLGPTPEKFMGSDHFNKQLYNYNEGASGFTETRKTTEAQGVISRVIRSSSDDRGKVDTGKLDRMTAMLQGRKSVREKAFYDQHDKLMMSGRHQGAQDVHVDPAKNFTETGMTMSGKGVDPDLAYKGTPMAKIVDERSAPADTPMWATGSPEVAHGYAPGTQKKDPNYMSHFVRSFNFHPLEGHGPGHRLAEAPWTPHIALTPQDFVERHGGGVPVHRTHEIVNQPDWKHQGTADRGFNAAYERVVPKNVLDAGEISRLKSLPSGRGYQQVKGQFTPGNHPMNTDYGNVVHGRDVRGSNDLEARRAQSAAVIEKVRGDNKDIYDPRHS